MFFSNETNFDSHNQLSTMATLEEISVSRLPILRDKFLVNWPENISSYLTLDNYWNWVQKEENLLERVKFFCLKCSWEESGTYVIIVGSGILNSNRNFSEVSFFRMEVSCFSEL